MKYGKQNRSLILRLSAIFIAQKPKTFHFGLENVIPMQMIEVTICLMYAGNGKVIGEFICSKITEFESEFWDDETYERIQTIIKDCEYYFEFGDMNTKQLQPMRMKNTKKIGYVNNPAYRGKKCESMSGPVQKSFTAGIYLILKFTIRRKN